jgi:hypothetical protein
MADNLPPSSTDVTESGSFNLPEPSGHHRPVMGMLYLLALCANGQQCLVYTELKDSLYSYPMPIKYSPNVFSSFLRDILIISCDIYKRP